MKIFNVDLYDFFKLKKPLNAVGELICYIPDKSVEINVNRKAPAMLVLPGGGYSMTSFREDEPIALKYLSYGFAAFVLRYSVAPLKHPTQLTEAVMAMNYIRLHAAELGVDEKMVSAVGFSAGGHLCAMLGSYYDAPEVAEVFKSEVSARPDAVILSYSVITSSGKTHYGSFINLCGEDNEPLTRKISIENLVNSNSAPAFIWATYNDGIVPIRNSLIAALAYDEAGVPFSIHVFGKGQHGLSAADKTVYGASYVDIDKSESVTEWVRLSVEWLKELGIEIKV